MNPLSEHGNKNGRGQIPPSRTAQGSHRPAPSSGAPTEDGTVFGEFGEGPAWSDASIKLAFDRMTPDKDAQARMLGNILAAAEELRCEDITRTDVSRETSERERQNGPVEARPRRAGRSAWAVGLPIAACLILLAGIGMFAFGPFSANSRLGDNVATYHLASEEAYDTQSAPEATVDETQESESGGRTDASAENGNKVLSDTESASTLSAPASSLPLEFSVVESEQLGQLKLVYSETPDSGIGEPSLVGAEIGTAKAVGANGDSVTCMVYEYSAGDTTSYAIRYEGDSIYYLATALSS